MGYEENWRRVDICNFSQGQVRQGVFIVIIRGQPDIFSHRCPVAPSASARMWPSKVVDVMHCAYPPPGAVVECETSCSKAL